MPSWTLYIDRSSTTMASEAGIVFIFLKDATLEYALQFSFSATNNEAEYEALTPASSWLKSWEHPHFKCSVTRNWLWVKSTENVRPEIP